LRITFHTVDWWAAGMLARIFCARRVSFLDADSAPLTETNKKKLNTRNTLISVFALPVLLEELRSSGKILHTNTIYHFQIKAHLLYVGSTRYFALSNKLKIRYTRENFEGGEICKNILSVWFSRYWLDAHRLTWLLVKLQ
jgi:hypothetical protein